MFSLGTLAHHTQKAHQASYAPVQPRGAARSHKRKPRQSQPRPPKAGNRVADPCRSTPYVYKRSDPVNILFSMLLSMFDTRTGLVNQHWLPCRYACRTSRNQNPTAVVRNSVSMHGLYMCNALHAAFANRHVRCTGTQGGTDAAVTPVWVNPSTGGVLAHHLTRRHRYRKTRRVDSLLLRVRPFYLISTTHSGGRSLSKVTHTAQATCPPPYCRSHDEPHIQAVPAGHVRAGALLLS